MKRYKRKCIGLMISISFVITCFVNHPTAPVMAEEKAPPTIDQLARGEADGWLPPSIEDLTQGKVKVGDLITAANVDLVRDYLAPNVYECVRQGMALRMEANLPPEKVTPRFFWECTEKYRDKAISDQNGTVRLKDGSPWPGGLPFPAAKTPLEVMANVKFGWVCDDFYHNMINSFVDANGNIERSFKVDVWRVKATSRLSVPPIGAIPGHENYQWRHLVAFREPRELRGMGTLFIRHYDEYIDPDEGFTYNPAFKRTIRISATTYQDTMAGMDGTPGDAHGLGEPFAYWDFKSHNRKLMLFPVPKSSIPWMKGDGDINTELTCDHGSAFPRMGWSITPVYVVEGLPNIKHIYGKKVFYIVSTPYWGSVDSIGFVDIYDREMRLWKSYCSQRDSIRADGIDYGNSNSGWIVHDLQASHTTLYLACAKVNEGNDIEQLDLAKLLKLGR